MQARALEGERFPISFRTLQLWRRAHQAIGPDGQVRGVAALIDRRGSEAAGGGRYEPRSPEAVDYFYGLFHAQSCPTIKTCHQCTVREALKHGWHWPASYPATQKWLDAYDCRALTCLMREGRGAWQHRYMPHNQVDYTLIDPGDLYVTDHTQCDFWIEHNGEQLRPWLTAIQDARTRCIVGWHLGTAAHQDSILAAMIGAFREWAIPRVMRIDNGKDFASKLLTGMTKATRRRLQSECDYGPAAERRDAALVTCESPGFAGIIHELGIDLIYAIPYSPWSKGELERWFGTFENNVGRTFATYCGNSPENRPEVLETIRRGYTREQRKALKKRYGRGWSQVARMKFIDQGAVPTLPEARQPSRSGSKSITRRRIAGKL